METTYTELITAARIRFSPVTWRNAFLIKNQLLRVGEEYRDRSRSEADLTNWVGLYSLATLSSTADLQVSKYANQFPDTFSLFIRAGSNEPMDYERSLEFWDSTAVMAGKLDWIEKELVAGLRDQQAITDWVGRNRQGFADAVGKAADLAVGVAAEVAGFAWRYLKWPILIVGGVLTFPLWRAPAAKLVRSL